MATLDELYRYYTVVVNNGSGCIFQPDSEEFTYILTVKHNITLNIDHKPKLDEIKVSRTYEAYQSRDYLTILKCFVHESLDYALIIVPKIENNNNYNLMISYLNRKNRVAISGFPNYMRGQNSNTIPEYRTTLHSVVDIDRGNENEFDLILSENPTTFDAGALSNIIGFSGSGLFYEKSNELYLVGIFPKINDSGATHGKVVGLALIGFSDIISENSLPALLPYYMNSFKNLKDMIFNANISDLDRSIFDGIVMQIKNFGSNIFESDIVPTRIFNDFKNQILISNRDVDGMCNKKLWLGFLEYLLIAKITLNYTIAYSEIENLCNKIRFKFSNSEREWTSLLDTEIAHSNYNGLKKGSKIIIQTNVGSSNRKIIKAKEIPSIINRVDTSKLQISEGVTNPFTDFDFIHIDYFLDKCIVDNLTSFTTNDTPGEIIDKLLPLFNEILAI